MMKLFDEVAFLAWTKKADTERNLSEDNYILLFDYLSGHGYALGVNDENSLCRVDIDDGDDIISYSMDELICDVSSWNSEMIQKYEYSKKILDISDSELVSVNKILEILEEQEQILDSMYRTTNIGKMIINACHEIAEEGV